MAVQFSFEPRSLVDSHHHVGRKTGWEYSGDDLVRRMDAIGIATTVVMHFVSELRTVSDFRDANDYVAETVARHPGRLAGAVCVHPLLTGAASEEIRRGHALGFCAVKLHPVAHGMYDVTDERVVSVVRLAGDLGMPVAIHSDFAQAVCSPYAIARLAERCPETTIVLLHMGLTPGIAARTPEIVAPHANVVVDCSATPDATNTAFGRPVALLGAERVVFGSDGPEYDPLVNLRKLEVAVELGHLMAGDAVAIAGTSARTVFHLEHVSAAGASR
jgi:hypothetical protein